VDLVDTAKLYPQMTEVLAGEAEARQRGDSLTTREADLGSKLYPTMGEESSSESDDSGRAARDDSGRAARNDSGRAAGWDDQAAIWEKQTREDEEIGGDRLDETLSTAVGVISEYGTPGLLEDLEEHGFGSHPELIRLLSRVGRELNELKGWWR
jgi:hypothetical protein